MKKVTLTVPWGQYDPILKKTEKKAQFITMIFFSK